MATAAKAVAVILRRLSPPLFTFENWRGFIEISLGGRSLIVHGGRKKILIRIHVHERAVERAGNVVDRPLDHLRGDGRLVDVGLGE